MQQLPPPPPVLETNDNDDLARTSLQSDSLSFVSKTPPPPAQIWRQIAYAYVIGIDSKTTDRSREVIRAALETHGL